MPPNDPKRILIVKLSAIGDVLMATPVAAAVRKAFPESYIAWVVERKAADVVTGNPYLDEVYVMDRPKGGGLISDASAYVASLRQLRRDLRRREFDVSLDFQGLLRSAVVSGLSGAKCRIGYWDASELSTHFYHTKYRLDPPDVDAQQRNLNLLTTIGINSTETQMCMPLGEEDKLFASEFFAECGLEGQRAVALCPATTWASKHWITERWSEVVDLLADKWGAKSVIMGSRADSALAEQISANARTKPILSVGRTTLKQAGAIIANCDALIGVDTGLLHMSVALGRPTVGLFGPSAWHCFGKKPNYIWVAKDFPCIPCLRHPTCSDFDCMRAIQVQDVDEALGRCLDQS